MKNFYILFILIVISFKTYGQWENLNTGINDKLNGVVFFQTNGIISGENGIYFTINGGLGSTSWTELHDFSNVDSAIFEDTKFTNCNGSRSNTSNTGIVYACGQTISDNKAVIFKINVPSMTYTLVYIGVVNTKLNRITCQNILPNYVAVGDNGKIISSNGTVVNEITPISSENLTAVIFVNTSTNLINIGGNDKLWRGIINGNTLTSITTLQDANLNSKDIEYNTNPYSVGGDKINSFNLGAFTPSASTLVSNFSSPLNANTCLSSNGIYIGTANGIYKFVSTSPSNCLEWQPSSSNFAFNRFWVQTNGTYLYACGDNGIVMRTSNGGGATKPYVVLNASGFCLGVPTSFSVYKGSGTSVKWYVDNQLMSTNLTGFSYTFPATGQYSVSVEVKNNFNEITTISQNITIYSMPIINKLVTLNDYILCKEEIVQVQIDDPEPNVKYILRKLGNTSTIYGQSSTGTGSMIQFSSIPISQSGDYYIEAVNTLSNCSKRFDSNIAIIVEQTHADFSYDLINANVGEMVNYYQNCQETVNYQWQFINSSGTQISTIPNPQNTYSSIGQVSVTLDASSANDCHDIITKNGSNVVGTVTNPDNCMLLVNRDQDLPWPGYYREDISQTSPVTDGFITCGAYNNAIFDSKYGVTYNLQNKKGGYLTKYDSNGILKWAVYTINQDGNNENNNYINSCIQDLDGNIYISGKSEGKFYDTAGHIINLDFLQVNTTAYFLIKLNNKGEFLWRLQNRYAGFNDLIIDNQNNIVAQIGCGCGFGYSNIKLYINGVYTQSIGNSVAATDTNLGIVKFSPNGLVLWDTEIKISQTNSSIAEFQGMHVDGLNNIYIATSSQNPLTLYSSSNTSVTNVINEGFIVAKYSPSGNLIWVVNSRTTGLTGVSSTTVSSFNVDETGNCYLAGRNDCSLTQGTAHIFQNADGSITQTNKGNYYLAKVNTDGVCEWIRSTTGRASGSAGLSILDNNEIFVLGFFSSGNSNTVSTVEMESTDNNNYSLTMDRNNDFLAVYDLNGNLKRVVLSYDGSNPFTWKLNKSFFKVGNYFYASRNLNNLSAGYNYFGNVFPAFTGYDGTTVKFIEGCGISMYINPSLSNNQFNDKEIKLYPNPTSGIFTIDLPSQYEEITIDVYDIYGKLLKKQKYTNTEKIVSYIEGVTGIYFLKITTPNGANSFKVIKE